MMRAPIAVAALLACASAGGDSSTPSKKRAACAPVAPGVAREIDRLLQSAATHASRSEACTDGPGAKVTIKLLRACDEPQKGAPNADVIAQSVRAAYRITVKPERACGGGCVPYPECLEKLTAPETHDATMAIGFVAVEGGLLRMLPVTDVPGCKLLTPLDQPHDGRCYGKQPPFEPRPFRAN